MREAAGGQASRDLLKIMKPGSTGFAKIVLVALRADANLAVGVLDLLDQSSDRETKQHLKSRRTVWISRT
jgi:hypothetical protein